MSLLRNRRWLVRTSGFALLLLLLLLLLLFLSFVLQHFSGLWYILFSSVCFGSLQLGETLAQ